ncbi:MAG: TetR/AcrR family transcriptional regulator [Bacteroidales bacterium]|nr:TetR/AcrR family transcriptional regulator [Bacteroidales bacterium]
MSELTTRQQEIVWSAISLIDEKGIQGLTIKNLAARMKFTEAAIYRHFKSKGQILAAIIDLFKSQTQSILTEKKQSTKTTPELLEDVLITYTKMFEENPAIVSVIFAEEIFQNESALKNSLMDIIESNEKFFNHIINQGQKKGEIRNDFDSMLAATSILGTFRLTVKKWKLNGFKYSLLNETKRLLVYFRVIFS